MKYIIYRGGLIVAITLSMLNADAQFWGAKSARPIDTPIDSLKRGEFTWAPELAPKGPIVVVVNLDRQYAYTYRNGILIGTATVSTGKPGHATPTGVFVTTLKDAKHRSSKYNNAPMPYTQRFTSSGIALHAGGIPNYPSSHGCVHLPSEYARLLFNESPMGMTVVVTDKSKHPEELAHPAFLAPVTVKGKMQKSDRLAANEEYRWNPENSKEGPVSVIISRVDERLVVFRDGIEIGRCKVRFVNPQDSVGTHVYVAHDLADVNASSNDRPDIAIRWLAFPVEDLNYGKAIGHPFMEGRVNIPEEFLKELGLLFAPGAQIILTDAPILAGNSGKKMTVLTSHPGK